MTTYSDQSDIAAWPAWVWVLIAIFAVLYAAILIYDFKSIGRRLDHEIVEGTSLRWEP